MNFNVFCKRRLLALVIFANQLHLAEVNPKRSHALDYLVTLPLASDIVQEDKIKNFIAWRAVLQQLVSQYHLQHAEIAFTLPYALTRLKTIYLPSDLPGADIELAIKQQIQQDILTRDTDFYIDYATLTSTRAGYTHYLYAAARADYIASCIDSITACGMTLKIIDVDILSFIRGVNSTLHHNASTFAILYRACPNCMLIVMQEEAVILYELWQSITIQDAILQAHAYFMQALDLSSIDDYPFIICHAEKNEKNNHLNVSSHVLTVSDYPSAWRMKTTGETPSLFAAYALQGLGLHEGLA